jgi:Phage ABA sandwich domain
MRNEISSPRVRISSLRELDALVGTRLTHETPLTQWEESRTNVLFPTVEEAIEALHDPHFRQFKSIDDREASTVLTEVKEFRRYTRNLDAAWDVVEQIGNDGGALVLHRDGEHWVATFGSGGVVESPSAPLAICVAALLARGVELEMDPTLQSRVRIRA